MLSLVLTFGFLLHGGNPVLSPTPDSVLQELKAGNDRFVEGHRIRSVHTMEDPQLRSELTRGQHPQAVIFACSDSRIVDNFIFDQEIGRLYSIQEAGNCPDNQGIASMEAAIQYLGCKVVVLMGHTHCGAVSAVADAKGEALPGHYRVLQASMAGLLDAAPQKTGEAPEVYHMRLAGVNAVRQARALIQHSELLRQYLAAGKVKVVPAVYDLDSGRVTFLEEQEPAVS